MKHFVYWSVLLVLLSLHLGCDKNNNESPTTLLPEQTHSKTSEPTAKSDDVIPKKTKTADDLYFQSALDGDLRKVESEILDGVNVNAADSNGRTALMLSAFNGHTNLVEMLTTYGADVNAADQLNRTALMYAASGPNDETVKLLLEKNADVNTFDNQEGWTALMFAAAEGQAGIVRILIDKKADLTAKDIDGETARDFAQNNGHVEVVKILDATTKVK